MNSFYFVMFVHWFADFILQTRKMGVNKSSSNSWLLYHILVYTLPLFIFGWKFAIFNGVAHLITDYFSSRASGYFYKKQDFHAFFAVIGFDQLIHLCCLYWAYHNLL